MDFFTGIWPIYKTVAKLDITKAGLIAGIAGCCGEMLQIFFGYFCDRGHRKKIMLLGLTLASLMTFITFTTSLLTSFLILLLLTIGSSSFHPAAMGYASTLSRKHQAISILLFASGGSIGLGISQLAFVHVITVFDGHALILFLPVLAVFTFLFLHRFPTPDHKPTAQSFREFIRPILKSRGPLILLYCTQVMSYFTVMAFVFLLPDLLHSRDCHSWLCRGGGHLCFILGSATALPIAGVLSDKYGQKSVLLAVLSSALLLLYVFLSQPSLPVTSLIILLATLGGTLASINPIIVSWGNRLVPESPSTVSGLLMGFAWCVANLGPLAAGFI